MRRCGVQFSKDLSYPNKLYIFGKGIYRRVRIIKILGKVFDFAIFKSNFREESDFRPFLKVRKNFKLLEHKNIIYDFEAVDLEIPNI